MERSDFARIAEQTLESHINNPPRDGRTRLVRMTSGTTGNLPMVFVREQPEDPPGWYIEASKAMLCGGSVPWRLGWVLMFRDEKIPRPAQILTIDAADLSHDVSHLIADFRPDMFAGFPSIIARVSEQISAAIGRAVRSIVMTGESLRAEVRHAFATRFPHAILRMQYMIQEIGYVSSPRYCPHLPLHTYHPARGVNAVQLDVNDPDETGAGELLVSARINRSIDITQYRYGDLARISHAPCACGENESFEIIGRKGHDFIRLMGATLRREEFDRAAKEYADLFDDYRVEARAVDDAGSLKGKVVLKVHGARDASSAGLQSIARRFSETVFLTPTRTLAQLAASGEFLPLEVIASEEPFAQKHKDVKLREL